MEAGWGLSAFIAMKTQPYRIFGMQQKQLVLRVKFKVIQASLKKKKKRKKEKSKINNLSYQLKELQKEKQNLQSEKGKK